MTSILRIDGVSWRAGLTWRHSFGATENSALIRRGRTLHKATHVASYVRNGIHEYGFFNIAGSSAKADVRFLAPTVAASFSLPTCVSCVLNDNTIWFLVVDQDGSIRPGTDLIISPDDLASRRSSFGLDATFQSINLSEEGLADLLRSAASISVQCRAITPHRRRAQLLGAAALVIGLSVGWLFWKSHLNSSAQQERIRQARANEAEIERARADALPNTPLASDWLASCYAAISKVRPIQMGWSETGWVCTTGHAMIRFARSDYATVWNRPEGRVTQNGDETDVMVAIPALKGRGGQTQHTTFADDEQSLRGIAQFYKGTLSIKAVPLPTPGQTSITTPAMAAAMDWRPFEMNLPVSPNHVPWSKVRALRFRSIEANESGFRIMGDLHAQ